MSRRRQFLRYAAATAVAPWLLSGLTACSTNMTADPAEDIEAFLADELPDGATLSIALCRGGSVIYRNGFGLADREADVAATADTVYDIGSVTKQFTATAILKLEAAGRLSVTDSISTYLPGWTGPDITVHQLLTHTSGLGDQLGDDYDVLHREELIDQATVAPLSAEPGAGYRYSNLGYSLLAAIIEYVAESGYEEYLSQNLFLPAGMSETGYVLPDWEDRDIAVERDVQGTPQGRPNEHAWAEDGPYWNLRGNGGILSTVTDMAGWHAALYDDPGFEGELTEKLFTAHVPEENEPTWYGYGWVIGEESGHRIAWHNGGNDRSYTEMWRDLDAGTAIIWSTNQVRSTDDWNLEELGVTDAAAESFMA